MWILIILSAIAAFIIYNLFKAKSRKHFGDYQMALRQIDVETVRHKPSWLDTPKEGEFFNGIVKLVGRTSVPPAYTVQGFMSPQSAEVLFSFAANMESQGASFVEQQMASAKFIEQMWDELPSYDKATFLSAATN